MQEFAQTDKLVSCEACSTRVPIKQMKFDFSGTELICQECYEVQKSRSTSSMAKKQMGQSFAIERRMERAANTSEYIFFKCEECAYSFSRKASFTFKNCPNCGKDSIKVVQKNGAQQVVDGTTQDLDLGIDFI